MGLDPLLFMGVLRLYGLIEVVIEVIVVDVIVVVLKQKLSRVFLFNIEVLSLVLLLFYYLWCVGYSLILF